MNKMQFGSLLLAVSAFSLGACTSVRVSTPYPQIDTPMVAGKTTFGFSFYGESGRTTEFSNNASSRPPDWDHLKTAPVSDVDHSLMLGLGSRIQVGAQYGFVTHMPMATAKLQLLGSPRATAKAGNFSLAAFGRGGWQSNQGSGDQAVAFGPGGYPWKSRANLSAMGYGGSAGIHLDDRTMLFGGVSFDRYNASARIDQSVSSDGSSPAYSIGSSLKGWAQSAGAGLSAGRSFVFNANFLATRFKWDGHDPINAWSITFGFEYFILGGGGASGASTSSSAKK
jgi:hypothetical protein